MPITKQARKALADLIRGKDEIQGFVIGLRMPACPSWMTPEYWASIYAKKPHSDPRVCPLSIGDVVAKGSIHSAFEIGLRYEVIGLHWTNSGCWRATIALDYCVCDWQCVSTSVLRKVAK